MACNDRCWHIRRHSLTFASPVYGGARLARQLLPASPHVVIAAAVRQLQAVAHKQQAKFTSLNAHCSNLFGP